MKYEPKSEGEISMNQFRTYRESIKGIIDECKYVIHANKKLYGNGLINFNPTVKLEELITKHDNSN